MDDSRKKSVSDAISKYHERQLQKDKPSERKNNKPEKEVEKEVLKWCKENGWLMQVFEAKGVFDPDSARWISGRMLAGTSDLLGVCPGGYFVAIELKAPGRRSTLMDKQRNYLISVITMGGFGVCIDSVAGLIDAWEAWKGSYRFKNVLLDRLPKVSKGDGKPIFELD